jgi:Transketolase, thiamine diphosphate binding domain
MSVNLAMAERWFVTFFNQPGFDVVDWRTNALCGDGCMMERISSEAGSLAGHLAVSRRAKLTPRIANRFPVPTGPKLAAAVCHTRTVPTPFPWPD